MFQELDRTLEVYNPFPDDISSREIRQNHVLCRSKNSDTILSLLLKKLSLFRPVKTIDGSTVAMYFVARYLDKIP